jgi:hypothetical protein
VRELLEAVDEVEAYKFCSEACRRAVGEVYVAHIKANTRKIYTRNAMHEAWLKSRNTPDPEKTYRENLDKALDEVLEEARPKALYARRTVLLVS